MLHEPADKFRTVKFHGFGLVVPVILPPEFHRGGVCGYYPAVADGHPVGVPAQIADHLVGAFERFFDIDMPKFGISILFQKFHSGIQAFLFFGDPEPVFLQGKDKFLHEYPPEYL